MKSLARPSIGSAPVAGRARRAARSFARVGILCGTVAVWVAGAGCEKTIHDVSRPDRRDSQLATAGRPPDPWLRGEGSGGEMPDWADGR